MFRWSRKYQARITALEHQVHLLNGDLKEMGHKVFNLEVRCMVAETARDQLRRERRSR